MSENISERLHNVQPIKAIEAHGALCNAEPGNPGDGDWTPRTYWDGWTEGHAAGETHGRRLSDIEHMFAADDAERRGYERGRQAGIDECGWPRLWRELGSAAVGILWWLVVLGFMVVLFADTFMDGKEAGLREARQTVTIEKKANAQ